MTNMLITFGFGTFIGIAALTVGVVAAAMTWPPRDRTKS